MLLQIHNYYTFNYQNSFGKFDDHIMAKMMMVIIFKIPVWPKGITGGAIPEKTCREAKPRKATSKGVLRPHPMMATGSVIS